MSLRNDSLIHPHIHQQKTHKYALKWTAKFWDVQVFITYLSLVLSSQCINQTAGTRELLSSNNENVLSHLLSAHGQIELNGQLVKLGLRETL